MRAQGMFDKFGKGFQPHINTHKIPFPCTPTGRLGAIGIACQKISEAEVFAAEGIDGIFLCFNLLSQAKVARARHLTEAVQLATMVAVLQRA